MTMSKPHAKVLPEEPGANPVGGLCETSLMPWPRCGSAVQRPQGSRHACGISLLADAQAPSPSFLSSTPTLSLFHFQVLWEKEELPVARTLRPSYTMDNENK